MGTKRPSCTLFDTPSNINTSDRKLQPGGKISRDPSPRPVMTALSERERDGKREEDWKREREVEKMREKAKYNDIGPRERYSERDRGPAPRPREGEREWRERERRREDDRNRNGRPLSNLERVMEREVERGMKKGDTFPKMRKSSAERARRMVPTAEVNDERGERRQRDCPKRTETGRDDWERERERARQRERFREREPEEIRSRAKEEWQNTGRRPLEDEKRYQEYDGGSQDRRRDLGESWDRRGWDAARKKEKPRPDTGKREARPSSPPRRRDGDVYSDRNQGQRRERCRDTRSEGDSEERDVRRERDGDREREELQYQHSRSEGDNMDKTQRENDQDRRAYRGEDRQKYRDGDREREVDRPRRRGVENERDKDTDRRTARGAGREGERCKESVRGVKDERNREHKQRKARETKERDPRWDDSAGRGSRSQNEMPPRVPPRAQSSGEWSTTESDRDVEEQRNPERAPERPQRQQKRNERQERDRGEITGSTAEQRRMWLEPQKGKNSKEEREPQRRSLDSQSGREGRGIKEEQGEEYLDQSSYGGRHEGAKESEGSVERETEGVSVDGEEVGDVWRERDKGGKERLSDSDGRIEGSWRRDAQGENVTDNTEESDTEEEGGNDHWTRSESEGGSETGLKHQKERMPSGEDGFVTLSSGGDEEDEREEDEEEEFEDCPEFLEGGAVYDNTSPTAFKARQPDKEKEEERGIGREEAADEDEPGTEKQPKYIFCVVGQTLPRSKDSDESPSQAKGPERDDPNLERRRHCSDDVSGQAQNDQHPTLNRDVENLIINNQGTESRSNMPQEERAAMGETTEVLLRSRSSSELQELQNRETEQEKDNPYAEIGPINRDSQTERLLVQWREKNKDDVETEEEQFPSNPYADVWSQVNLEQIQPILERINTGTMSPEEVEAIRVRLSGAWSMSEEPKRHSQAPHLKWAKNVVREILGTSEEQTLDQTNAEEQGNQGANQSETAIQDEKQSEEVAQGTREMPVVTLNTDGHHSEPELEMEEPLEVDELRGMGQSQADMHADQFTAMHGDTPTYTNGDTLLNSDGKEAHSVDQEAKSFGHLQIDRADIQVKMSDDGGDNLSEIGEKSKRDEEVEMYLSVSNTLYKPTSCPFLSFETKPDLSGGDEGQKLEHRMVESEEERQGEEPNERSSAEEQEEVGEGEAPEVDNREVVAEKKMVAGALTSSCSFRDLGPEARLRRRGIRKTTQRRNGEHVEVEEEEEEKEEGVGRDRRTRIFSTTDDEDDRSKSWGEVELRSVLETIDRRRRNSKFFNAAQLYQQYSEAAQNFEILRQARSDVVSVSEESAPSPAPSPPPARRPLPPLPPVRHPHSLLHTGSVTSVRSLPLPELPKSEGRPPSPRLSVCLTQSSSLWRELPGVRNSTELEDLSEDQRRLQEVRFEVVTSEASYCRSLEIVVEHFVKSKQLGALLTTQDRNWLFSRLADVRAISHSFLSKLEERVETDIIHFTVCDIIARHCQRFKMVYVPYLTNQSYQDATYQRLMNQNPGFKRIVDKLERSPVCQRLPLRSFLVLPFQRITRIKLLVQNIVKRTTPGTAEATQAIRSLKLLEKLIQESNDSITQMKSIESLVSLSAKVDFECRTLPLISQSRRLVREGPVTQLMDFSLKERNVYMHLFTDYLLLSLQKEGGRFTVIDHAPVSDVRVENCRVKLHSLQKNLFQLHMAHKALLLRTDTQSDKLRWISALSRPHPEIDFSAAQDFTQMQCIRAFVAQQSDELSLEKADIILVHQQSSDHWVEGTRLSDRHRGWVPGSHLETITNSRVQQRNLSDALKLTTATAAV